MMVVRCKSCNKELSSANKLKVCGCPNMVTLTGNSVSALDLAQVVMINSDTKEQKNTFSSQDIAWQESRRKRKVRKLDFEVR